MNHKTKKMGIFILGILVGLLLTPLCSATYRIAIRIPIWLI